MMMPIVPLPKQEACTVMPVISAFTAHANFGLQGFIEAGRLLVCGSSNRRRCPGIVSEAGLDCAG